MAVSLSKRLLLVAKRHWQSFRGSIWSAAENDFLTKPKLFRRRWRCFCNTDEKNVWRRTRVQVRKNKEKEVRNKRFSIFRSPSARRVDRPAERVTSWPCIRSESTSRAYHDGENRARGRRIQFRGLNQKGRVTRHIFVSFYSARIAKKQRRRKKNWPFQIDFCLS